MALPMPTNTTCDIYRVGNTPPAAPDVAGVACHLRPAYQEGLERGDSEAAKFRYTHVLSVNVDVDIRDDFNEYTGAAGNRDEVYIPDKTGIGFKVNFVERVGRGGAIDHKRVYLDRKAVTWPVPANVIVGGTSTTIAGGGGVEAGGQPTVAINNLLAWYKADAITGLADGDAVASWVDSTGNGHTAAQSTAGKKPVYKTSIINSLPVVRFDGVDDSMDISSNFDRTTFTLLMVSDRTGEGTADANNVIGPFGSKNDNGWSAFIRNNNHATNPNQWGLTKNGVDAQFANTLWPASDGFVIQVVRYDGATIDFYRGLTSDGSFAYVQTFSGGSPYTIGCVHENAGPRFFEGDIAEIMLFGNALSNASLTTQINSLKSKYNL
jgi:hypothetical protein